ncbi:kynureninase [Pseudoalteromonas sp. A25]|uniref:aminotransferase class V-fold PLP-dependent enzyme n=1 Tax=Pseudoalteromonas sp. A25 TaxID=116092 RepID=UPI00126086AD|nr:aminotransferase class V-fold PLP-dependent enzyme [Pseudoalteromonas sp. A25]BBN83753.1 kynureninase [Pseudoalteromonas sp. A25]
MTLDLALQLQPHYSDFKVSERILLSGHSHQAWPNAAKNGLIECYQDAATHVDDKWGKAFEKAQRVKNFYAKLLGEQNAQITLGASTHELLLRFLSDLECFKKPPGRAIKIVTTDGEFHSMRRQLNRFKQLNMQIEVVSVSPSHTLAQRLVDKIDSQTDAVMLSAVFYGSSEIFRDVGLVAQHAHQLNVPCLVDTYHALNVVPFDIKTWQLEHAFIVSGGYKYCQAGEGNCMMRIPQGYNGSPIITGWYAEFSVLDQAPGQVSYGAGAHAFEGSTYDPSSHYRAAAVFDFFEQQNLEINTLRTINQQQIAILRSGIESAPKLSHAFALASHKHEDNGGFLALTTPYASQWVSKLHEQGIQSDSRGEQLRLGPAPYVSAKQLEQALSIMEDIVSDIV